MGKRSDIKSLSLGSCPKCSSEVIVEISDPIREANLRGRKEMQGFLLKSLGNAVHPEVRLVFQFIEGVEDSEVDAYVESHERFVKL